MKKLFLVVLALILFWGVNGFAEEERCPLTGNVYAFELGDTRYELSGFECTFGPGCQANCDLWYGDFSTGPLWHIELPFACKENGDVIIAGLPCGLTSSGDLKCLMFSTEGYACEKVGMKHWCVPEETGTLEFGLVE